MPLISIFCETIGCRVKTADKEACHGRALFSVRSKSFWRCTVCPSHAKVHNHPIGVRDNDAVGLVSSFDEENIIPI